MKPSLTGPRMQPNSKNLGHHHTSADFQTSQELQLAAITCWHILASAEIKCSSIYFFSSHKQIFNIQQDQTLLKGKGTAKL